MSDALLEAATQARLHAHAPYSGFRVGAAVSTRDGRVFTGVNVENASFGLTVCAERNALAAAVAQGAKRGDFTELVIVADAHEPTPPCGACRQVMAEFLLPDTPILLHNLRDKREERTSLGDLLPRAFDPTSFAPPKT